MKTSIKISTGRRYVSLSWKNWIASAHYYLHRDFRLGLRVSIDPWGDDYGTGKGADVRMDVAFCTLEAGFNNW
jgi:hypothetical protein